MRIFFHRIAACALLLAPLAPSVRADATLRFHTDIKTTPAIPAAALDQALADLRDMVIRVKGNKGFSSQGNLTSIVDLMTQDLTLVDPAHKRFATLPAAQYAQQVKGAMPAVPEQARTMFASMKSNLASRSTGRTATIQGIQTDEQEFVLTVDMAVPGGPGTSSPFMKMVIQMWSAQPNETQRVPALQEFRNYTASASSGMNPTETIKQVLSGLPGLGDSLGAMVEEMSKKGAMSLRTHMEISMPILAVMSQQVPGQALPAGLDPNAPLMQMNQEVVELSSGPLDDALFEVPSDYQRASLEEILQGAVSAARVPQFRQ